MTKTPEYSAHIGYLFTDLPLVDRIAAAARAGFRAVEHPAPYQIPAPEMAQHLRQAGLRYTQFGLRSGDAAKGEKGIGIFSARRAEFRETLIEALDYAATIGVRMVHAMSGILPAQDRRPEHFETYVDNLVLAARMAAERGITILIEPMSAAAVPDYLIATPAEARAAIKATGEPNIGILLDIFHTAAAGLSIPQTIAENAALIRHVHIADYPGRHEPGSAGIDFDLVRGCLAQAGYAGALGCEYSPATTTEAGLGWLRQQLNIPMTEALS